MLAIARVCKGKGKKGERVDVERTLDSGVGDL
jgi:hypothetical protein